MEYVTLILSAVAAAAAVAALIVAVCKKSVSEKKIKELLNERASRDAELRNADKDHIVAMIKTSAENQNNVVETLRRSVSDSSAQMDARFEAFSKNTDAKFEALKTSNDQKLGEIKTVVDEKLQKTLNERFTQSFETVSKSLASVQQGLGEMKELASDVGDLKSVMTNVKTRGGLGEIQLESILAEILPKTLWERQYRISPAKNEAVDFVVKLPGSGETPVLLPIDSKLPVEDYKRLVAANSAGNREEAAKARKSLEARIKEEAKDISDKYIKPPLTTDFALMYLPFEGLYAEVTESELHETLRRDYRVNVTGPSTVAAFLNSLQLGFRTLEIQKRSGEVWRTLGAVKTEFEKFGGLLEKTQKKLNEASGDLETLIGTRSNMIRRSLKSVSTLPDDESAELLAASDEPALPDSTEI